MLYSSFSDLEDALEGMLTGYGRLTSSSQPRANTYYLSISDGGKSAQNGCRIASCKFAIFAHNIPEQLSEYLSPFAPSIQAEETTLGSTIRCYNVGCDVYTYGI